MRVDEWPVSVAPGELETWLFDASYINQETGLSVIDPARIDGTVIVDESCRVVSSVPVTAHQFNPLNGDRVYTNPSPRRLLAEFDENDAEIERELGAAPVSVTAGGVALLARATEVQAWSLATGRMRWVHAAASTVMALTAFIEFGNALGAARKSTMALSP